jgi:para-aminobenzoate synthetase component 1
VPAESNLKRYPLIREVSTSLEAAEAFELLKERPFSFFLDSGMDHEKLGRYSFIGSDPFLVLKSRGEEVTLIRGGSQETVTENPFDVLGQMLEKYALDPSPSPIPFIGGGVGYLSYDLCHFVERLPATTIRCRHRVSRAGGGTQKGKSQRAYR